MLHSFLGDQFSVNTDIEALQTTPFDLIIVDIPHLVEHSDLISRLKEKSEPVILPLIALMNNSNASRLESFWDIPDDIIHLPTPPNRLLARIKVMLKIRDLSTSLSRKKRKLEEQNEELKIYYNAVHSTPTGIVFTNPLLEDNPIIFCNKGFENMTGYSQDEIVGLNCRFLQGDDHGQDGLKEFKKNISNNRPAHALLRNYKKDGTLFWNELYVSPLKDEKDKTEYFVGVQNDVTQLVKTQGELKEALNQKQTLIQEIHHRVKNNLAVISGMMELQMAGMTNQNTIDIIKESQSRIISIAKVHELLYQQTNLNEIDFDQYIRKLIDIISVTHSKSDSKIEVELAIEEIKIGIDQAIPIGLLLNELISNTAKHGYAPDGKPKISLSIQAGEEFIEISYRDYGKGLDKGLNIETSGNFGMMIIRTLLQQLDAEWKYKSMNGFHFYILIKKKSYSGFSRRF